MAETVRPFRTPEVLTANGAVCCVVLASPSWPLVLMPQQKARPSATAQLCDVPAEMAVTVRPERIPLAVVTATALVVDVVEPLPSWPLTLFPQQ